MPVKTQAYRLKSGTHSAGGKTYRPGEIIVTDVPLEEKWPTRFTAILVRRRKGQPEVNQVVYDDELSPEDVAKLGDIPVDDQEGDEEVPEPVIDLGPELDPEPITESEAPVKLVKKHIKSPKDKRGWWVINEATGEPVNDTPLNRTEALALERGE